MLFFSFLAGQCLANSVSRILMMGASCKSVMFALLSFAAWHMANRTGCPLVGQLGLEYKSTAMGMILEASRGPMTNEGLEAIIATSMILSWRADEWCVLLSYRCVCCPRGHKRPPPSSSSSSSC
jgi:hypothetical protein